MFNLNPAFTALLDSASNAYTFDHCCRTVFEEQPLHTINDFANSGAPFRVLAFWRPRSEDTC